MRIIASGHYCEPVQDAVPDLRELVKATTGKSVRRVNRFIQLALIGAARCVGSQAIDAQTAVYMASPHGDLEVTQDIVDQIVRHGLPPKPLSFINSVSNAASFYIAQNFALEGRSSFICNRFFAFESALQLAHADIAAGLVDSALIGVVDVVVEPLRGHRLRAEVAAEATLCEASHWLWLGAAGKKNDTVASASKSAIVGARHFSDQAALRRWLADLSLPPQRLHFCAGQSLAEADAALLKTESGAWHKFDAMSAPGLYNCRSAAVIADFEKACGSGENYLLYVNADPLGRYSAFIVSTA